MHGGGGERFAVVQCCRIATNMLKIIILSLVSYRKPLLSWFSCRFTNSLLYQFTRFTFLKLFLAIFPPVPLVACSNRLTANCMVSRWLLVDSDR